MDFSRKFEPRGNKILHGAGQSPETFKLYWDAVGKNKPLVHMSYIKFQNLSQWIDKIKSEVSKYPNIVLQIGLNLKVDNIDRTKEISLGDYEKELTLFIDTLIALKRPTFLRIGYEFDEPKKYQVPSNFIAAWKYIVEMYKSKGAENIANVWCSCPFVGSEPFRPYYPGDDFVDWFGIDLFSRGAFLNSKNELVEDFMNFSIEKKRPVMICESSPARTGVDRGIESWNEWFVPYFDWIDTHPNVKAFCYINWDWGKDWKQPEWLNGRIHENKDVLDKYIAKLQDEKFIHNLPQSELFKLIRPQ